MKNILFVLLLACCMSCSAQKSAAEPVISAPLTVITISGEEITFKPVQGSLLVAEKNINPFTIPADLKLEEGRIYYISFKYLDCDECFKRKILILGYTLEVIQVQKDKAQLYSRAPYLKPEK